jgi:ATP-dependent helicase/nuclease subunit A
VLELTASLQGADLGTWLHRCFEMLGMQPTMTDRLVAMAPGDVDPVLLERVVQAVARFEAWLKDGLGAVRVLREWPLLSIGTDGAVVSGVADLLVETPEGTWIIDHKSDRVTDARVSFGTYQAQLDGYAEMLEAAGRRVAGVGIHWIRRGEVALRRR